MGSGDSGGGAVCIMWRRLGVFFQFLNGSKRLGVIIEPKPDTAGHDSLLIKRHASSRIVPHSLDLSKLVEPDDADVLSAVHAGEVQDRRDSPSHFSWRCDGECGQRSGHRGGRLSEFLYPRLWRPAAGMDVSAEQRRFERAYG